MSKLLHDFIDTVNRKAQNAERLSVPKAQAIAARDFIQGKLDAAAKGGSAKGSGPKPRLDTPAAIKHRERVKRYRDKKKRENDVS